MKNQGRVVLKSLFASSLFAVVALFAFASLAHADTPVCGIMDTDTVWTVAESPYTLTCDVTVASEATLDVTAEYTLKNLGDRTIQILRFGVVARGPGCDDWSCSLWADFPAVEQIFLGPDEEYHYNQKRDFHWKGEEYFAEPAFMDSNGWWFPFYGGSRVYFSVEGYSVYLPIVQR